MCEEASRGDGHPMPNSSHFVFPDDRRARGVQQWSMVASKGDWKSSVIKQCKGSASIRESEREVSIHPYTSKHGGRAGCRHIFGAYVILD